jgi:hypothetical protein
MSVGGRLHSAPLDGATPASPVPQIDDDVDDGSLLASGRCLYWTTAEGTLVSYDTDRNERRVLTTEAFGSVPLTTSNDRVLLWSKARGPDSAALRVLRLGNASPPLDLYRAAHIERARADGAYVAWVERPPPTEKQPAIQLHPKAVSRVYRAAWT